MSHKIAFGIGDFAFGVLSESNVIPLPTSHSSSPVVKELAAKKGNAVRITKATIAKLVCPPDRDEVIFWDEEATGLGLRCYKSGRRVWLIQYRDANGRSRRVNLGLATSIDPATARQLAHGHIADIAKGANPAAEKREARQAKTVAELVEAFLERARHDLRPTSYANIERHLRKNAKPLLGEPISAVTRAQVARLHQKIGAESGKSHANRVIDTLGGMWNWGLKTGLIDGEANPAALIPRFMEKPRERVLTPRELALIWAHTGDGKSYSRIVRLLMLTGCRRQEIGGLRWSEINGDLVTIPSDRMKNGRVHEVPLSELAMAQLPERGQGACVFSKGDGFRSWSKFADLLERRMCEAGDEIAPWTLHDLRRTLSTIAHEKGLGDPHVIEAVLAHVQPGVAKTYNHASYRVQKRELLEKWAALISEIIGDHAAS